MIENVVFDIDGVFTNGTFIYTADGKVSKTFGAHDSDGIQFLKDNGVNILTISADKRGFKITERRMLDMGLPCRLVSGRDRLCWMKEHNLINKTAFMGDGVHDAMVMKKVAYSIAPANAIEYTRKHADYVTKSNGGDGAVFEACLHICEKFFDKTTYSLLNDRK